MTSKRNPTYPRLREAVVSLDAATGKLQTLSVLRAWRVATAHRLKRPVSSVNLPAATLPAKGPRR